MSREVRVAALQCALGDSSRERNIARVEALVRQAAADGARIVLPPELFEGPYFPQTEDERFFELAHEAEGHPTLKHFSELAAELGVVLPVSFFERSGPHHFNSLALIDADGRSRGVYRKSHIPDGPGYEEKFYFRPGDSGFRVWKTRFAPIGVGICWDQWFPEAARAMALGGAELLFYPTAIGTEPHAPDLDTKDPWQRVMVGHAVANWMPVVAANRIGKEGEMQFYGSSFIADATGAKLAELKRDEEGFICSTFELDELRTARAGMGFFRDRRPDLYTALTDG